MPRLEARLDAAQRAAAADARVQNAARSAAGERRLAEVMAVGPARAGDLPPALAASCPPGSQPEIPRELADLATQIAIHSPTTTQALGRQPTAAMAAMSATKTSVVGTPCERSQHLCVSPVFTWGGQALWTIVDLTDLRLVGAASWTDQGQSAHRRDLSEATLEDAAIAPLCNTPQTLTRDGWRAS